MIISEEIKTTHSVNVCTTKLKDDTVFDAEYDNNSIVVGAVFQLT